VVEDNAADIELLRFALDRQGDHVLEVLEDGEAALRFVAEHRAGLHPPDPCVILLDVHLPKYDGLEILDALKGARTLQHIQVIVMSSIASPEAEAAIRGKGAIYRTKPVTLKKFLELGAEIFALCKEALAA
jgi:CheY-like chemotaxis protein